jgi:site-specific DNA-methyltransferase (cytosine-N4-specific)
MPLSPVREITALDLGPLRHQINGFNPQFAPLDIAIDLNFPGVETQHSTHAIHPYVAAINPPLAAAIIRHYVPENGIILDPFCGGGGVLVEAALQNRQAVGCDVNPLAVLISRVKTRQISSGSSLTTFQSLTAAATTRARKISVDDVPDVVRFWYLGDSLAPLKALSEQVLTIKDTNLRELFQAVLSATARDVMLTYRGEIRLRRLQGVDLEKFRPNVQEAFKRRALIAIGEVAKLPRTAHVTVHQMDCRKLTPDFRCHTVVTSPPYGDDKNGVGYFQFSRNMLYWIGVPLEEQKSKKDEFLGSMANGIHGVPATDTLQRTLALLKERKPVHHREAASFYADYYGALQKIASLASHRVIVIIGDRVLSRTKISNGHITTEFMRSIGWELEHYSNRQLVKKRIANLGGDGGGISIEHIMVFRRH